MKNRILRTVGTIDLAEMELMTDTIELIIPVIAVSDNLKATIAENIQKAKDEHQKEFLDCHNLKWSDAGIFMENQSLRIVIAADRFSCGLRCSFSDMENDLIETGFEIKMDFSEHITELKKLIVDAIINKFL